MARIDNGAPLIAHNLRGEIMKTHMMFFVLFSVLGLSQTALSNQLPINIDCNDGEARVAVGLSLVANKAWLSYQPKGTEEGIVIDVVPVLGIYSNSSVDIGSQQGGMYGNSQLIISAHMARVLRVTHYASFNLVMNKTQSGEITANKLEFERGIDAFPDSQIKGAVDLSSFTCVVNGL